MNRFKNILVFKEVDKEGERLIIDRTGGRYHRLMDGDEEMLLSVKKQRFFMKPEGDIIYKNHKDVNDIIILRKFAELRTMDMGPPGIMLDGAFKAPTLLIADFMRLKK